MEKNRRLVYSTDPEMNRRCPRCKQLLNECVCPSIETVAPGQSLTVKLRIEKNGRGGKTVTVLYDLPANPQFLKELAGKLKRECGTGGTVKENSVELQGDYRERLRQLLPAMGYKVKG
jgi:translation initiation factor 1